MSLTSFEDALRVGIIQTTIENSSAWTESVHMSRYEEERVIAEIQQHVASLTLEQPRPHIILLPELSVPEGFLRTTLSYVGKTYPAWREEEFLAKLGYEFQKTPEVWLFDAGPFGRFAVAICYDFLDLERVAMYRLRIQSLFVLAYNNDLSSFEHAAEALARMIYCNIVICNTGHFGGSAVLSPYHKPERRILYRHQGNGLSTSQTVSLPISSLIEAQSGGSKGDFKSLPPGAEANPGLVEIETTILL